MTIFDVNKKTVQRQTSGVVGISDRITSSDGDFYGKTITASSLSDGHYSVLFETINASGQTVTSNTYNFTVDTKGPNADNVVWEYRGRSWPYGRLEVTSPFTSTYYWKAKGVTDPSGIDRVKFVAGKIINGTNHEPLKETTIDRNYAVNGDEIYMYSAVPNDPNLFDEPQAQYMTGFRIFDTAGNYTDVVKETGVQLRRDYHQVRQVYNPNSGIWEDYRTGMTVYENPFRARYQFKSSEMNSGGDPFGWTHSATFEGEYAYIYRNIATPADSSYVHVETASGTVSSTIPNSGLTVVLAPGVEKGPKIAANPDYVTDKGDGSYERSHNIHSNKYGEKVPFNVTKAKGIVEERSYKQRIWFSGLSGHCVVPAGQTSCEIPMNVPAQRTNTKGYIPNRMAVCKTEHPTGDTCASNSFGSIWGNYLLFRWDIVDSEISDINLDNNNVSFLVTNNELHGSWDDHYYADKETLVVAENNTTHEVINLSHQNITSFTLQKKRYEFELSSLPEGSYSLKAFTRDNFDNRTTQFITRNYVKDNSAPSVIFKNEGQVLGNNTPTIRGLEGLAFVVSDASQYTIKSVNLKGGPINDNVLLATRALSQNEYAIEYPRIFPSLEPGQDYQLEVSATDIQDNNTVTSVAFSYLPPNIIEQSDINVLAVDTILKDGSNKPISVIELSGIKTDAGDLAHGPQTMVFTLRKDSPYAVIVNENTIAPGASVEFTVQADEGKISVPVYPAVKGVEGRAYYFTEIPVIQSQIR